ncbi:MAG: thermonuclease family protein [Synergistaceae bacterium]|jgi:micrococcal nuclease|nr:thermonuclease family protein [Synergistaceae bacterium]
MVKSQRILWIAITILLILSLRAAATDLFSARVNRVIDGDTVEIAYNGKKESVRLIGVDTPETKHPTKGVQPYGPEASAFTKESLEGRSVWLEWDVEQRDRYGRLLAYVWTARPSGRTDKEIREKMFNARLLLDGYAQLATFPPNVRYVDFFKAYQTEARESDRGLWGGIPAKEAKNEISESGYVGNGNSKIFHKAQCSAALKMSAKNKVEIKSREDALDRGYRPCKICNP